jgi:hypothetical protein
MYPITTGLCACVCDGITADINTTTEPTTIYVTADLDLVQMLKVNQAHAHNPVVIGYIVVELCTVDPVIDVDVTMGTVENMVVVMV